MAAYLIFWIISVIKKYWLTDNDFGMETLELAISVHNWDAHSFKFEKHTL